jgi:hypothetical protein
MSTKSKLLLSSLFIIAALISLYFIFWGKFDQLIGIFYGQQTDFSFFTIQSNLIAAIWFLLIGLTIHNDNISNQLLSSTFTLATIMYVTLATLVYWIILVPITGHNNISILNIWQHGIAMILSWGIYIFLGPEKNSMTVFQFLKRKETYLVLIYPIIYLIYAFKLEEMTGSYVYPILDASKIGGELYVFLFITGISMFLVIMEFLLIKIKTRKQVTT